MKKYKIFVICLVFTIGMLCTGCSRGPLDYSEVVGNYGSFECDDSNIVWPTSEGGKYITIKWDVSDSENGIVSFKYMIEDENIECYDEDFWTEYHEAGFENPEDALEEYIYDIAESYELPEEGDYEYDRSERKLVSVDSGAEYYKKD